MEVSCVCLCVRVCVYVCMCVCVCVNIWCWGSVVCVCRSEAKAQKQSVCMFVCVYVYVWCLVAEVRPKGGSRAWSCPVCVCVGVCTHIVVKKRSECLLDYVCMYVCVYVCVRPKRGSRSCVCTHTHAHAILIHPAKEPLPPDYICMRPEAHLTRSVRVGHKHVYRYTCMGIIHTCTNSDMFKRTCA